MQYWLLSAWLLSMTIDAAVVPLFPSLRSRLQRAIEQNEHDQVLSLLVLGADPNVPHSCKTALQCAVVYKNPLIMRSLLQAGAHITDDILERFLSEGTYGSTEFGMLASLTILLGAGAKQDTVVIKRWYLDLLGVSHGEREALHAKVVRMIEGYGKEKIP